MYNVLLINVDELWLKGKNRPVYYKAIREHIRELIKAYHCDQFSCLTEDQRIVTESETPFSEETIAALLNIPGVHSILPSRRIPLDFDALQKEVIEELSLHGALDGIHSFKVETRRSYKGFPMTSMEVSSHIGEGILNKFPHLKAEMRNAQLKIEIRIMKSNIYAATRKLPAIGGLPAGTGGHLISLISGGFDSPVASYLMAKRGCRQSFIFFYAYPFVGDEVKKKIIQIVSILGRFQRHSRLYVVPFGNVQEQIAKHCDMDYRTLLFRKAMIRCASKLARRIKADGLLTGDALGQVSSQTVWNMAALNQATPLPIFRPLSGFNKIEIIQLSKKIGTHDVSVIPHDDACSLFAPKHPVIKPSSSYLEKFDTQLPLDDLLEHSLDKADVYDISITGEVEKSKEINHD